MKKCIAIARHGRIELIISKKSKEYSEFAKVLTAIDNDGYISWYGDVMDSNGRQQSGLIITNKPR